MRRNTNQWQTAVGLGVMAGMRSLSAPAWVTYYFSGERSRSRRTFFPLLRQRAARRALTAMAAGEAVLDKLPQAPARIQPPPLIGRAVSGALSAAAIAGEPTRSRLRMGALGFVSAVASSFGFYALRKRATKALHIPNVAAGLIEDAGVGALGAGMLARA